MTGSEKIMNSVMLALIVRLTVMLTPLVASAGTYVLWKVYTTMQDSISLQESEIRAMQKELDEHQSRLDNGRQSRLEFQNQTTATFDKFDKKLEVIADKLADVNDSVIRVQTIIETRLPRKSAERIPNEVTDKIAEYTEESASGSCQSHLAMCR